MPYVEFPVNEFQNELIRGTADGDVEAYTFGDHNGDGEVSTEESTFAGIIVHSADSGDETALKMDGLFRLWVNGSAGGNIDEMDPIKPTTNGYGVLADTDGDQFSAIAMEACTTDSTCILVKIAHGYVAEAAPE
jgi:hypothetical protein